MLETEGELDDLLARQVSDTIGHRNNNDNSNHHEEMTMTPLPSSHDLIFQ